jgi:hypothetical protein
MLARLELDANLKSSYKLEFDYNLNSSYFILFYKFALIKDVKLHTIMAGMTTQR